MDKKTTYQRLLFSGKENEVIETLNTLNDKGYPEIIPDIIKVYLENPSPSVKENALFILNNLKDKASVSYFMKGLELSMNNDLRPHVISACWQNGLDFSPFLTHFIKIIVSENFDSAIEAYSVIESNVSLLDDKDLLILRKETEKISKQKDLKNLILFKEVQKLIN